ncbi:MAG: condensation domain-containing protein [Acidimicrobiales bacterium]
MAAQDSPGPGWRSGAADGSVAVGAQPARLDFSPLDEAVHILDSPEEPWTVQVEVRVAGQLDEARLRAAVHAGLARHSLARGRALPARPSDRVMTWEITEVPDIDALSAVDLADDPAVSAHRAWLYSNGVPLEASPPLRVWLVRRPAGDLVMVSAHHAAFDGVGTLRVLQSISRAYAGEADPDPLASLPEARDIAAHLATDEPALRSRRRRALAGKALDLVDPPARLGAERPSGGPGYGLRHLCLLPPPAGGRATVNDVLVAALNMAVDGWNAEHGVRTRRVGVLVPVNLRPEAWRTDVVTNFVVQARVTTGPADRRSPQRVLDRVVEQTRRIKEGEGAALFEVLRIGPRLPLWIKRRLPDVLALTGNRLVDTAVLSNLGRVADPPSFGLGGPAEMWFSAPTRMPCGLSVGSVTVGGRLHLAFRYRKALWGDAAADRFAERFAVELGVVAREAS